MFEQIITCLLHVFFKFVWLQCIIPTSKKIKNTKIWMLIYFNYITGIALIPGNHVRCKQNETRLAKNVEIKRLKLNFGVENKCSQKCGQKDIFYITLETSSPHIITPLTLAQLYQPDYHEQKWSFGSGSAIYTIFGVTLPEQIKKKDTRKILQY